MKQDIVSYIAIVQAILAAALFGISAPFSKLLLKELSPLMLSALLYFGAGFGMLVIFLIKQIFRTNNVEARLAKDELPFVILMIILDIAAPISLMRGLTMTTASNASLLNNFEIVATSIIALVLFREAVGRRLWISIAFITISSIILTVKDFSSFSFSIGSIFVLLASIFWGLENNCTRKLSIKDPMQIVIIKGIFSGVGAFIIAYLAKGLTYNIRAIFFAILLGFFAYGMSILLYVTAQRHLGAARTSAYYAVAPFIGVGISFIAFDEPVTISFVLAAAIMIIGTYFAIAEKHNHEHLHSFLEHEHRHNHSDGHHNHTHEGAVSEEHSHIHIHEKVIHAHEHRPDIHHSHRHEA